MRITNTSMIRSHMYDTQENLSRMSSINEKLDSGKEINRVSDDPHKAIRIMNLSNEIRYTEKYNSNIDETVGWMNTTDGSLEHFSNVLGDIKEDLVKVGNDTYSETDLKSIQSELNEKIKEIAENLNTTYGGKYMFGGSHVDEAPIKVIENPDGTVKLEVNKKANTEDLRVDVSDGINIDYNTSVGEIFNIKTDDKGNVVDNGFLDTINNISVAMNEITTGKRTKLDSKGEIELGTDGKPVTTDIDEAEIKKVKDKLLGETKGQLDNLFNHTLEERTSLGVRVSTAEKVKDLNDENILNMKGVRSMDQDVDYVKRFIESQSAMLVYQASIKVGTKLIQPTIMDYLR